MRLQGRLSEAQSVPFLVIHFAPAKEGGIVARPSPKALKAAVLHPPWTPLLASLATDNPQPVRSLLSLRRKKPGSRLRLGRPCVCKGVFSTRSLALSSLDLSTVPTQGKQTATAGASTPCVSPRRDHIRPFPDLLGHSLFACPQTWCLHQLDRSLSAAGDSPPDDPSFLGLERTSNALLLTFVPFSRPLHLNS